MKGAHPCDATLAEVATALRCRQLSAVELARACIARIEDLDPHLNCFLELEPDRLLGDANKADTILARGETPGVLHGVPLAHKDMFYRAGRVSTCGSKAPRSPATVTATALRKLENAGALCAGFLHMSEFAIGPSGHNPHYGPCLNPWDMAHAPGGSSSGSGSAVAARLVFGSLGSDTGGSVRVPAAACGVVGLKPTNGRVSRYGIMPRAWSLDTVGPLARTVEDVAILLSVIEGHDEADSTSSIHPRGNYKAAIERSPRTLKIGLPTGPGLPQASEEVQRLIEAAVEVFRALDVAVVEVTIPNPTEVYALAEIIAKSEAATIHGRGLRERPDDYSAHARARIDAGFYIPATH
jgi:aspartyl-tRNA(Asn)/glutamyl-tRNA(Gln) amidotransferase subunit A